MKVERLTKEQILAQKLLSFKDKAFCSYTHGRADSLWKEIRSEIPEPYRVAISIEWSHIQIGHGYKQACAALDEEIKKYISYMLRENKTV